MSDVIIMGPYLVFKLIPMFILLVVLFSRDKHKETKKKSFLFFLLIVGVGISIPIGWINRISESIITRSTNLANNDSIRLGKTLLIILIGEIVKYKVLKRITWKSEYFRYRYDAILYAVLISLGFSMLSFVPFSAVNEISGLLLMFFPNLTFLACLGVFQGGYYAKVKYNALKQKKNGERIHTIQAIMVPFLHRGLLLAILYRAKYIFDSLSTDTPSSDNAKKGEALGIALVMLGIMAMIIIYAVIVFVMAIAKVIKESPGTKAGNSQHTNDDETCGDREDAGSDGQNEEFCFFETENG